MPTNEERREVAARLRSVTNEEYSMMFVDEILAGCIGGTLRDSDYDIIDERVVNRLADLIEPELERTCHPVDVFDKETRHIVERGQTHYYWPYSGCSECGCDFPQGSNFCPNCGAKVVE